MLNPSRTIKLRPGLLKVKLRPGCDKMPDIDGKSYPMAYGWVVENGPYKGETAWIFTGKDAPIAWIPSGDLVFDAVLDAPVVSAPFVQQNVGSRFD